MLLPACAAWDLGLGAGQGAGFGLQLRLGLGLGLGRAPTLALALARCAAWDLLLATPSRRPWLRLGARWVPLLCALASFAAVRATVAGALRHTFRRLDNPLAFLPPGRARLL